MKLRKWLITYGFIVEATKNTRWATKDRIKNKLQAQTQQWKFEMEMLIIDLASITLT